MAENPAVLNAPKPAVAPTKSAPPVRKSSPLAQSVVAASPTKSPLRGR